MDRFGVLKMAGWYALDAESKSDRDLGGSRDTDLVGNREVELDASAGPGEDVDLAAEKVHAGV